MARLDAFIDLLVREAADSLVLETGAGATLHHAGGGTRALLKQTLTSSQIAGALGEVLPAQARGKPPRAGTSFTYASPSGPMLVACEQGKTGLRVVVTPEIAEAELEPHDHAANDGDVDGGSLFGAPGLLGSDDDAELELESERFSTPDHGVTPVAVRAIHSFAPGTLDALVAAALDAGASDIHLTGGTPVSIRVDGALRTLDGWATADADHLLWPALSPALRDELAKSRAVTCVLQTAAGRVRAHLFAEARGTAASLRLVLPNAPGAHELGLGAQVIEALQQPRGLILLAGQSSSGRTTTLASLVEAACELRSDHVVALHQTLEFVHRGGHAVVRQREIPAHAPTLAEGIRQAMRGDANVLAIDELRDAESCALALEAADRGHLVIATVAAPGSAAAVDRMAQHGASLLADTLRCVVAQTLCTRTSGGRVPAFEVLLGGTTVSAAIREGKTFQLPSIQQAGRALGMTTLNDALLELVRRRVIEPREAWARSLSRAELRPALERAGFALQ